MNKETLIKLIDKFSEMRNKANYNVKIDKTIDKFDFGKKIGYFDALVDILMILQSELIKLEV